MVQSKRWILTVRHLAAGKPGFDRGPSDRVVAPSGDSGTRRRRVAVVCSLEDDLLGCESLSSIHLTQLLHQVDAGPPATGTDDRTSFT